MGLLLAALHAVAGARALAQNPSAPEANKVVTPEPTEVVVVSNDDSNELQRITPGPGRTVDVTVYLASLGDMVGDYLVTLRRDSDNKRMQAVLSDKYGQVLFQNIPPGYYHVEVGRKLKDEGELTSISVGDVRLAISSRRVAK